MRLQDDWLPQHLHVSASHIVWPNLRSINQNGSLGAYFKMVVVEDYIVLSHPTFPLVRSYLQGYGLHQSEQPDPSYFPNHLLVGIRWLWESLAAADGANGTPALKSLGSPYGALSQRTNPHLELLCKYC